MPRRSRGFNSLGIFERGCLNFFVALCSISAILTTSKAIKPTKKKQNMTIEEIVAKLEAAGCSVNVKGGKAWVNATKAGGKGNYGYLVEGDNGTSGTCKGITKRAGEIAGYLRA